MVLLITAMFEGDIDLAHAEIRRVVAEPEEAVGVIASLVGAVQWAFDKIAADCGTSPMDVVQRFGLAISQGDAAET